MEKYGRLTLPTDLDVIDQTIELKNKLGADAIRDCDGTDMPQELMNLDAKIYATYYTTRKDNEWAEANPDEIQQEYLITDRYTARDTSLTIELMKGFHTQQLKVNDIDAVSYTHLDVYKRQVLPCVKDTLIRFNLKIFISKTCISCWHISSYSSFLACDSFTIKFK